jgi:hypothetical protein
LFFLLSKILSTRCESGPNNSKFSYVFTIIYTYYSIIGHLGQSISTLGIALSLSHVACLSLICCSSLRY